LHNKKNSKIMPAWVYVLIVGIILASAAFIAGDFYNTPNMEIIGTIIIITIPIIIAVLAPTGQFKALLWGNRRDRKILKTGRSGKAKIISISESEKGVISANDQPLVKLEVEIYDGNKPPRLMTTEMIISRLVVPQFQPGKIINIKIDQKDSSRVVFDLNST
jgi:hypothetical protein